MITMTISLYTARVILNTLGASDYGLYGLISGVVFMFGFLQDTLTRATLKFLCFYKANNDRKSQTKVFSISFILHMFIAILAFLILVIVSNYLFSGFLKISENRIGVAKYVYYLMIVNLVFTIMSIPYDSALNANENMQYYSIVGIVESMLKMILALCLPYVSYDKLLLYSLILAIISISSLIAKWIYCYIKYDECKLRLSLFDKKIAISMATYAGWNLWTLVTYVVSFNSIPVLLNFFFGTIVNAAQSIVSQVNGVLISFSTNMLKSLTPVLNKTSGANEFDSMMKFGHTGTKLSFLILCFFSVPILVEGQYIFKLWLVNVPEWTIVFCVMQILRSLANQLTTVYVDCVYTNSKIKKYCIIKSILNILPIPFVYLMLSFGYAPYITYVIFFVFWEFLGGYVVIYFNRKMYNLNLHEYIYALVFPCVGMLLVECTLGYAFTYTMEASLIRLILNSILVSSLYVIISWFVILRKQEKYLIKEMCLNKLKVVFNRH